MTTIEKLGEQKIIENKDIIIAIAKILGYKTYVKNGIIRLLTQDDFFVTTNTEHTVARLAHNLLDKVVP